MKFIDQATIEVRSGKGGAGASSFRREKYIPKGGPDGGNGGNGGSVVIQADINKHTLLDLHYNPLWTAENGKPGQGSKKDGTAGADLKILVPIGTQVLNHDNEELIVDLSNDQQEHVLANGGRGGKGNTFFKSSTNRSPEHAQPGEPGEEGKYILNLKLVADVGMVGFPNAGKSTLLSCISAAKPKIADYPFTTLTPNLGLVKGVQKNFVIADIPGLIPGASSGKGLGIQFLKHVERTKALLFLIDPLAVNDEGEPINVKDNFQQLQSELQEFSPELAQKKSILVIGKNDLLGTEDQVNEIRNELKEFDPIFISSLNKTGIEELIKELESIVE